MVVPAEVQAEESHVHYKVSVRSLAASSAGTAEHKSTVGHNEPEPKLAGPMVHVNISEGSFLCTQYDDSDQISVTIQFFVPVLPYILLALGVDLIKDKL